MQQGFRPSALVPRGFVAESAIFGDTGTLITVRHTGKASACPRCGRISERIHSRYHRHILDLPVAGRPVRLIIVARRFRCDAVLCGQRIFTERFDKDVLAPWARRTTRLEHIIYYLGLALGGRPAASFANRLMLPVSNDTLLRAVRRRGSPRFVPPTVVGIDDWAWRRNQRYGTILCDLERRKTIALLPDREPATAQAWLSEQPQITIVSRDRGGGYAVAAAKALPNAIQVADRWHLMENASHAFLDAVRKSMRQVRAAIGAATINPKLLTSAGWRTCSPASPTSRRVGSANCCPGNGNAKRSTALLLKLPDNRGVASKWSAPRPSADAYSSSTDAAASDRAVAPPRRSPHPAPPPPQRSAPSPRPSSGAGGQPWSPRHTAELASCRH